MQEEGKYRLSPSSTMLWVYSAEGCVDVVIRLFLVTSTSLSFVLWGLFGFSYTVLGSVGGSIFVIVHVYLRQQWCYEEVSAFMSR